jgi:hypothetical protein
MLSNPYVELSNYDALAPKVITVPPNGNNLKPMPNRRASG